jgi:hypothetical protein
MPGNSSNVAFSFRPLTLADLAEVVAVDFDSRDLPWFDCNHRYYDARGVLRACSGFVFITEGIVNRVFEQVVRLLDSPGKVELAHFEIQFPSQSAEKKIQTGRKVLYRGVRT